MQMYSFQNKKISKKPLKYFKAAKILIFVKVMSERISLIYQNLSNKYVIRENDFTEDCFQRQFYFFYRSRIAELTQRIKINGLEKLGKFCLISVHSFEV